MSKSPRGVPHSPRRRLPVNPSLEHLRKQSKRLARSRKLALTDAQHTLAKQYGCRTWKELTDVVETMSRGASQLVNVKRKVEALPKATRARDLAAITSILESEEFTVHDLDSALAHAAWYGGDDPEVLRVRKAIFDLLLEHGADPDGQYGSNYGPLVLGCGECLDPHGLRWLLEAGADVTFPPVKTKYGRQCPLSYVLGTYVRGQNERKHEMIDLLLTAGAFVPPKVSPAILAIHRGDRIELGKLLDADPALIRATFPDMPYGNLSLRGATLLHCAVEFGEIECVKLLLDSGADVNARAQGLEDGGGQTSIYHAIASNLGGNFPVLKFLLEDAGVSIDWKVKEAVVLYGQQLPPMSPLEYAKYHAEKDDGGYWRTKEKELALLARATRAGANQRGSDCATEDPGDSGT